MERLDGQVLTITSEVWSPSGCGRAIRQRRRDWRLDYRCSFETGATCLDSWEPGPPAGFRVSSPPWCR